MKKLLLLFTTMCCMMVANAQNEHATKIEYENGKYMYFILNESEHTAYVTWGGKYDTAGTDEYTGCIQIPASVNYNGVDYRVVRIGDYAFYGCSDLSSISFPEGLERIGGYAFSGCLGLNSVSLPKGLKVISVNAFEDCKNLTSISLPEGLQGIFTEAFLRCARLTSLTIPSTVTDIGDRICYDATNLAEVFVYSDLLTPGVTGSGLWDVSIPIYVTAKSFLYYKKGVFLGYENVRILPGEYNIGEVLQPYLNLTDEEVEIYNELLKARNTMGKPQSGPAIEVIDQNDKVIRLYNPKSVNFIKATDK